MAVFWSQVTKLLHSTHHDRTNLGDQGNGKMAITLFYKLRGIFKAISPKNCNRQICLQFFQPYVTQNKPKRQKIHVYV